MKTWELVLICFFVGLLLSLSYGQQRPAPPSGVQPIDFMGADYSKAQITWNYSAVTQPAATGFHLYCGDAFDNSPDGTMGNYPLMQDIPDPKARDYLMAPLVDQLVKYYSKQTIKVRCRVYPYNAAGEAGDSTPGVPEQAANVRYQQLK